MRTDGLLLWTLHIQQRPHQGLAALTDDCGTFKNIGVDRDKTLNHIFSVDALQKKHSPMAAYLSRSHIAPSECRASVTRSYIFITVKSSNPKP